LETAVAMSQLEKSIWVVIPGYNEETYLSTVLKKVQKYTDNIIVVDDGSKDSTGKVARKYTPHVLIHGINLGKGAALKTGCEYAFSTLDATAVIIMDSDDQHNPKQLPEFNAKLATGSPIVFGARRIDSKMPLLKRIMNRLASYTILLFFGGTFIPDIPSGYKAFSKQAYRQIRWNSMGYQVEMEIACRVAKFRIPFSVIDIDTIYHDHDKGMTILNTLDFLQNIVMWRLTL
jgi:glycosyltransferase involved in cell wall biosynthesis